MSKAQYIVRRTRDQRPIAGIFVAIRSQAMAERILAEWQANYPTETFHVETV
jgi:ornithine cyclodeaminase/alanine dehydrogenase-like protein (mu-crystallin family)